MGGHTAGDMAGMDYYVYEGRLHVIFIWRFDHVMGSRDATGSVQQEWLLPKCPKGQKLPMTTKKLLPL